MSVHTFEILSVELAQALSEQASTPPETTARCTLGRNKVMVLVEYASDSARSARARSVPPAPQTLDWLEQWLRHQFDTTGLPEEAADLASNGSEVDVQLFLKYLSESKPYKMRSFVWKVDDGFDDLFGLSLDIDPSTSEQDLADDEQVEKVTATQVGLYSPAVSSILSRDRYETPAFYSAENGVENSLKASAEATATEPSRSEAATAAAEDSFAHASAQMEERQRLLEAERFDSVISGLSDAYFPDHELVPSELDDEHLQLELEPDLEPDIDTNESFALNDGFDLGDEPDLEEELGYYADASLAADLAVGLSIDELLVEPSSELHLPGEPPELDSSEFNLPTLDLPETEVPDTQPIDADFFDLEGVSAPQTSLSELPADLSADLSADVDDSWLDSNSAVEKSSLSEDELDLSGFEGDSSGFEAHLDDKLHGQSDSQLVSQSDSKLYGTEEPSVAGELDPIEFEAAEAGVTADGHEILEFEAPEAYEDEDLEAYEDEEPETYEDEEPEAYEDDPAYYLAGEAVDDEPMEEVALVDETEVQRQRDQWNQQSRTNPWVFVGALGFALVGILGFVFTRPCTFGSCDRLQTAQQTSTEALNSLREDSSLASVTDAKQQLKRSVSLLSPIPMWSRYYGQAQAVLPAYEEEIKSLDYVTEAQKTAYQAAVDSQNPPHPASEWQKIAKGWGSAADGLEKVPADSPMRELTERKLGEYRANRATILVRIDAESKAETSLRQAQQAAGLGTKQVESASSMASWETALVSWETAVDQLSRIPKGTYAYGEAQKLLPTYLKKLDEVRDRTQQERSASRTLFQAKQQAAGAHKAEAEGQWSASVQGWKTALSQLQNVGQKTLAHASAQTLQGSYATSLTKAENNLQVALRFQPLEPNFFAACSVTGSQKCTYSLKGGNVRIDLFQGYDTVIDQSITPPDQRAIDPAVPQLVGQSNQLLQDITLLSAQAEVPIELYDAKGNFLAAYRPELKGFTRSAPKQPSVTADL